MMTREIMEVISKIADRAILLKIYNQQEKLTAVMDLECVYDEIGLKVDDLLSSDNVNFYHDLSGIKYNLNRRTKRLENCFLPRYS